MIASGWSEGLRTSPWAQTTGAAARRESPPRGREERHVRLEARDIVALEVQPSHVRRRATSGRLPTWAHESLPIAVDHAAVGCPHRVFFIVSPWFLAATAALGRDAGGIPDQPGQVKEEFTMMGWYGGNGMGSLGWLGMGVFWLILLGLIIWLVVRLLPGRGGGTTRYSGEASLEILDRRLASGEIDMEAWRAQRAALVGAQGDRR